MSSKNYRRDILMIAAFVVAVILLITGIFQVIRYFGNADTGYTEIAGDPSEMPELDVELLTVNEYSRPGTALTEVNGVVVHYTANPGTDAIDNRNYFEGLKDSHITKASSHFIIGLDGTIVQCIPTAEVAYASNDRNYDTLSIECCHPDETGKFNQETYESLIELTGYLCVRFGLTSDDVIRHYDVTGKNCPKYYVENEDAWEQFKIDLDHYIDQGTQNKE